MNLTKVSWYLNRLKSMSVGEIIWRIDQSRIELLEREFSKSNQYITDINIYKKEYIESLLPNFKNIFHKINKDKLHISNPNSKLFDVYSIPMCDGRINWHYGFKQQNMWPMKFSYDIDYKQNDIYGCARINWELNRHYNLVTIAENYYITSDKKYLSELKEYFYDWVEKNPFLIGISWTSVMEVAIRSFSWLVILNFINQEKNSLDVEFNRDIEIAILNQVYYITKHYSRFSSANNHLIVEMMAIGLAGISFKNNNWVKLALKIFVDELERQNHEDGINREQSIHYHTFVMEAVSILICALRKENISYPKIIDSKLKQMAEFIANIIDRHGNIADIGDSDEGKLLNLSGSKFNHYLYVLQISSVLFGKDYTNMSNVNENLYLLFEEDKINLSRSKYDNSKSISYSYGGHTILKYKDEETERLMTVDHAPLGFGAIAAHGHSDALSITLSVDGEKFIVDPGTYIYHVELPWRNYFRKTINHNTITINCRDQSEMKGSFLWGKRAESKRLDFQSNKVRDSLFVQHDGYKPVIHTRNVKYIKPDLFIIEDILEGNENEYEWDLTYMLDNMIKVSRLKNQIELKGKFNTIYLFIDTENINIEEEWQSKIYGNKVKTNAIRAKGNEKSNKRILSIISINKHIDQKIIIDSEL